MAKKSWNYWELSYRDRYERTRKMFPIVVILGLVLLVIYYLEHDLITGLGWFALLFLAWGIQAMVTKSKAEKEPLPDAAQPQDDQKDGSAQ
jgi:hypothetical protein